MDRGGGSGQNGDGLQPGDHIRQLALRVLVMLLFCDAHFYFLTFSLTTMGSNVFFFYSMQNRHQWRLGNAVPASEMAYMVQWLQ